MQTLLAVHVYAGILGPLLAIIHTGHKFDSPLGIALTAVMLLVVVSGFAVRYLLTYVGHEIADKLLLLQTARGDLDSAWGVLEHTPAERRSPARNAAPCGGPGLSGHRAVPFDGPAGEVTRPRGIAWRTWNTRYRTHELFKRWFVGR